MILNSDSSVTLDRAELVYLLKKNKIPVIIGLDMDAIIRGQNYADFCKFGKDLYSNSLIKKDLKGYIDTILKTLSTCNFGIIIIKKTQHLGEQLFIYNFSSKIVIEHTQPSEGQHRFMILHNETEFYNRLGLVIPIINVNNNKLMQFYIPLDSFPQLIDNLRINFDATITEINNSSLIPDTYKKPFIDAIQNPEISISILAIKIKDSIVEKIDSYAIFANTHSCWGVSQEKDKEDMTIYPAGLDDIYNWIFLQRTQ